MKYLGSSLLLLSLTLSLLVIVLADERGDHKCGPPNGNPPCGNTRCCSVHNFCGGGSAYCQGGNCRYQCWFVAHGSSHDLPRALLRNNDGISEILSESVYNEMFKHMKDCPSQGFYNYDAFLAAAASFPGFATTGDVATRKRELAAFFGQTSQATTGQWSDSIDSHAWGYCHINGTTMDSENDYCTSSHWPCASGKKYNSRGPVQLTDNYNYGLAGDSLGIDLINNPDLVATDPILSFKTAIWFWMTQHDNKPSCHDIVINANYPQVIPSYGVIGNIINGQRQNNNLVTDTNSIGYYKRYCDILGVSYGDNLKSWYDQSVDAHIQMHRSSNKA
ncbi:mulatexin-like isoform X2 [Humulus lupulus]|uniref:mulatexin-like isoform X2 n=1 Tax=Humulus lupulus TaxID=3486 RepID=UPI002B418287|nr:mulatexin-like isoform X2 [Humulus lupulus]